MLLFHMLYNVMQHFHLVGKTITKTMFYMRVVAIISSQNTYIFFPDKFHQYFDIILIELIYLAIFTLLFC